MLPSKNLPTPPTHRIRKAKIIEQPLIAMPPIRMRFEAILLLSPPLVTIAARARRPAAALRHPRHAELARADLDVLALQGAAGARVQAGEAR
jgi:hypothetical protein